MVLAWGENSISTVTSTNRARDTLRTQRRVHGSERHRLAGLDLGKRLLDRGVQARPISVEESVLFVDAGQARMCDSTRLRSPSISSWKDPDQGVRQTT
jgi:hypothetical protein